MLSSTNLGFGPSNSLQSFNDYHISVGTGTASNYNYGNPTASSYTSDGQSNTTGDQTQSSGIRSNNVTSPMFQAKNKKSHNVTSKNRPNANSSPKRHNKRMRSLTYVVGSNETPGTAVLPQDQQHFNKKFNSMLAIEESLSACDSDETFREEFAKRFLTVEERMGSIEESSNYESDGDGSQY